MLFSSLVDDPSAWPELFPNEEAQKKERNRLFKIIKDLVLWENSNDNTILLHARKEIVLSISRSRGENIPETNAEINKYLVEKVPFSLDPFCGGGSIPLEAKRLGLRAYGSDLNPVSVLITKGAYPKSSFNLIIAAAITTPIVTVLYNATFIYLI